MRGPAAFAAIGLGLFLAAPAAAQEPFDPPQSNEVFGPLQPWPSAEPPKPTRYSMPWQLRRVTPANIVRLDSSFAHYEDAKARSGMTIVNMLSGGYAIAPCFGVNAKLTTSEDSPPSGRGGFVMDNPVVGAAYGVTSGDVRFGAMLNATIPVGGGGGDHPGAGALDARKAGQPARFAIDNSVFAPNDFALIPGLDFAWVAHDVTVQFEVTYFELHRVRGEVAQAESTKRNFTEGVYIGWFPHPIVSVGGELRYQHWLNPPFFTKGNDHAANAAIDQASFSVGPRFHIEVGDHLWLRPGIAFARGLDLPLAGAKQNYDVVQVDVPFFF